jgi:tripartite-type tricarboxylate transporter receptor subunit TctC
VRADSRFKTLGDLLAEARAKPGSLTYGMAGVGTTPHLAGELMKHMAKVDIAMVAYRGGAPVINDLLGGHIPISFNNAPEALGQIKGGAVRALAVTTATARRSCRMCPPWPKPACRATTAACGGP